MKSISGKFLFGFGIMLLLTVLAPKQAEAIGICSDLDPPTIRVVIPGYGDWTTTTGNPDKNFSITVPSGTVLTETVYSFAEPSSRDSHTWPNGQQQVYNGPLSSGRTHTTGAITAPTTFRVHVVTYCQDSEQPDNPSGHFGSSGSLTVSVGVGSTPPPPPPPPPVVRALGVVKAGTGSGTVTGSGISCGSDCSETYNNNTSVSLTATPAAGSTFAGWSGSTDCSNDAGGAMANPTGLMMNANKSCTATFNTTSVPLPTCSASPATVAVGQSVTITAANGSGGSSPYYTWDTGVGGGTCATGGTCTTSYSTSGTKTITVTRNGVSGTCTVSASNNPPTAAFTGSSSCTVNGWGDDIDTTVARPIRIYSDGNLVSTVTAGTPGCSGTGCTFSANLSGLVSTGVAHTITGQVQGDTSEWIGFTNSQTSLSLTCPVATVSCSGPSAGQTGQSYTFTATGGAAHTWAVSPTTSLTPSGSSGSGSSISKAFGTIGTKTITFTRTDNGATNACVISITATPPALSFDLFVNGTQGPITVAYNTPVSLTWGSTGATSVQKQGSTPLDSLWNTGTLAVSGSQVVAPATLGRVYSARAVNGAQTANDSATVRVTPECLQAGQTALVGQTVSLTARGGNGTYAWTSTGATPASGNTTGSNPYSVSYATAGTKSITVTSDSLTSTACTVTVTDVPVTTGTVIVNSNVGTTWTLSGGSGKPQNQGNEQTSETYEDMEEGTYTVSNVPDIDGYESPVITPASSQDLVGGGTITFTITYEEIVDPTADGIDLEINGSDNPAPVAAGTTIDLTWTSSGISQDSCVASDGVDPWGGSVDDEGHQSVVLSEDATFTITCDSEDKDADPLTDSVSILATFPECSDSGDNDNDGFTDFSGGDLECDDPQDNREAGDDDETGGEVTECSDGFDNDGDGGIDFSTDRQSGGDSNCSSFQDDSERGSPDIREI